MTIQMLSHCDEFFEAPSGKAGGFVPCPKCGREVLVPLGTPVSALAHFDRQELEKALLESVKLQSHYAGLLNAYDGGRRLQFESPGAWLLRLRDVSGNAGGSPLRTEPAPGPRA